MTLAPCSALLARWIREAVGQYLLAHRSGHGSIYIKTRNGHEIEIGSEYDVGNVE